MDLEGIMLNKENQRKTNTVQYPLYVESKNITKEKHTHRCREQTRVIVGRGKWGGTPQ